MEENTVLSTQGDDYWPMEHYAFFVDEPDELVQAIEDAREEHRDYGDMESKLRLGGLELLRDVHHGV